MAFLVMSGWDKETLLARKAINDGDHLLAKPFTPSQLRAAVQREVSRPWANAAEAS